MQDFGRSSGEPITKEIVGKIVVKCEVVDEGLDNILQFTFVDGSVLRIRYDWIYEWEIRSIGRARLFATLSSWTRPVRYDCPVCPTQRAPDAASLEERVALPASQQGLNRVCGIGLHFGPFVGSPEIFTCLNCGYVYVSAGKHNR